MNINTIKLINRFLLDNDHFMYEPLHVVDNKSIWRKLFKWTTKYAGSIRRTKTTEFVNGVLKEIDCLIICYFNGEKVKSYTIRYENGIIRESDEKFNRNFAECLNHFENFICKYNVYTKFDYTNVVKKLKKDLKK